MFMELGVHNEQSSIGITDNSHSVTLILSLISPQQEERDGRF